MVRVPTHREPTHPGEMLLEEFLKPMDLTQRELANAIHVPYQRVNEIVNRRRCNARNSAAFGEVLRHVSRILDEFAVALGFVSGAAV